MYIVSSSSGRKEFESIHEAIKIAGDTDDIYTVDGFGNCTKLDKSKIAELVQKEPKPEKEEIKEEPKEQPQETQPATQKPPETVQQPVKPKTNAYVKWAKIILLGAIAIMLAYFVIKLVIPAVNGLMAIFTKVL